MIEKYTTVSDLPFDIVDGKLCKMLPIKDGLEVYGIHAVFYENGKKIQCLAFDYDVTDNQIWERFEYFGGVITDKTTLIKDDWTEKSC